MVNIYNVIKDISEELNIEFDNVLKLFKSKFINIIMIFVLLA